MARELGVAGLDSGDDEELAHGETQCRWEPSFLPKKWPLVRIGQGNGWFYTRKEAGG